MLCFARKRPFYLDIMAVKKSDSLERMLTPVNGLTIPVKIARFDRAQTMTHSQRFDGHGAGLVGQTYLSVAQTYQLIPPLSSLSPTPPILSIPSLDARHILDIRIRARIVPTSPETRLDTKKRGKKRHNHAKRTEKRSKVSARLALIARPGLMQKGKSLSSEVCRARHSDGETKKVSQA